MAAKKGKTTRKYRQAKQAAKPAAKAAFPGKVKASRKDPLAKLSNEDRLALKEMRDTAKADLGKNAYLSKADYEANQAKAREAFRSQMRTEFGEYGGKKATPEEIAMRETKAGGRTTPKKKTVKKVSAKGPSLVENGKVVSESRAKEIMSGKNKPFKPRSTKPSAKEKPMPKKPGANYGKYGALDEYVIEKNLEREEKAAKKSVKKAPVKKAAASKPSAPATSKPATAEKPITKNDALKFSAKGKVDKNKTLGKKKPEVKKKSVTKSVARPTDASLTKMEDDYINKTRERLIKEGKLSGSKEVAIRPKGEVVSTRTGTVATTRPTPIPGSDTVVKKGSKLKKLGKFGVVSAALAAGLDAKNMVEGSKRKAQAEADLFYAKKGRNRNVGERIADVATKAVPTAGKQLAKYFTMGLAGEDVSVGAAKAEKALKKYQQAKIAKNNKGLRYGPGGESLVPGTSAYKKGSKTRPSVSSAAPSGTTGGATGGKSGATPGAGGSTITVTPGSTYTVKKGDTLSAIAKASGVSLAEIRKANKKFATNPKYKQGNMIWSGTKVNIPKK